MYYILIDSRSRIALSAWHDELAAYAWRSHCTCRDTIVIEARRKKYQTGDIVPKSKKAKT
jgi:hypothetical protein